MQLVLKDAFERATSGGSSSLGDVPPDKLLSSLEERRPRGSADGGSLLSKAGER